MISNDIIILDEILEQKKSEIAPELPDSEFFEVFAAEQILKDFELSYEELRSGIVGGGGDGGIDSVHLFVDGDLVQEDTDLSGFKKKGKIDLILIQAKINSGFQEPPLDKFLTITSELLDLSRNVDELAKVYNAQLINIIRTFRRTYKSLAAKLPNLTVSYYYATKGDQPNQNVQRKVAAIEQKLIELFSSSTFKFEFVGARTLLNLARRLPQTSHDLKLAENPLSTADKKFVCLVKLRDFYSFITDDGKLLRNMFDANVRDYQGSNEVNNAIQDTLKQSGKEDFWWLNNGITIVATDAASSGKILTIENPQIVNGLQTSSEIFKFFSERGPQNEERNVLIRIIVPPAPDSRDRIIKATNSQTKIPTASLRATEQIHRDIEQFFKTYGLFYDRRKNFYKNEGKPIDKIISIPYLAQAVMSIALQRPNDARARPSSLLKKDSDYKTVFNNKHPIPMYLFCVNWTKKVEKFLRSEAVKIEEAERTNLRYYLAMYSACVLVKKAKPTKKDIALTSVPTVDDGFFIDCLERVVKAYTYLGASDQVAKGTDLVRELKNDLVTRFRDTLQIESIEAGTLESSGDFTTG